MYLGNISTLHKSNMAAQIPQNDFFPRQTAKINIYFDNWLFMRLDLCIITPSILILLCKSKKIRLCVGRFGLFVRLSADLLTK